MSQTRTGPLVKKLVEGVQADMEEIGTKLSEARALVDQLAMETRGVNGLSNLLKAKRSEIDNIIDVLETESVDVAKKMLGGSEHEITQTVNEDAAKKLAEKVP